MQFLHIIVFYNKQIISNKIANLRFDSDKKSPNYWYMQTLSYIYRIDHSEVGKRTVGVRHA